MGLTTRMLIIMLTINIVLTVIQWNDDSFNLGNTPADAIFSITNSTQPVIKTDTSFYKLQNDLNSNNGLLATIDFSISIWGMIKGALGLILSFFFAPVYMCMALEVPIILTVIFGTVWAVVYIVTIFSIIWRWDI